jgi:hypothetical protein
MHATHADISCGAAQDNLSKAGDQAKSAAKDTVGPHLTLTVYRVDT